MFNGKLGKVTYKKSGKSKAIDLLSPTYEISKSKKNAFGYTKDFLDRWRVIKFEDGYYIPKFGLLVIE